MSPFIGIFRARLKKYFPEKKKKRIGDFWSWVKQLKSLLLNANPCLLAGGTVSQAGGFSSCENSNWCSSVWVSWLQELKWEVMSSSATASSLSMGSRGVAAGANPSCLWARVGYSLDKSPAHRRALTGEQCGVQYLAQGHFDMQLSLKPEFEPASFRSLADLLYLLIHSRPGVGSKK